MPKNKKKEIIPAKLKRITTLSEQESVVTNIDEYRRAKDYWKNWQLAAAESYQFVRGIQWKQDDLDFLEEQGRPALTYNIILPTVMAASGTMRLNKFSNVYSPYEDGDVQTAELLTKIGKHIDIANKLDFIDPEVYVDGVISGIGWYGMDVSYESNIYGDIIISRENPLLLFLDPNS